MGLLALTEKLFTPKMVTFIVLFDQVLTKPLNKDL